MPVFVGSRYETARAMGILETTTATVETVFIYGRERLELADIGDDYRHYELEPGDWIDELAFRFGGRQDVWWKIADVSGVVDPLLLEPGDVLIIPSASVMQR